MRDWLDNHPEIKSIRTAVADLNGQPRGKRTPVRFADKATTEGTRFPYSVLSLDIWGDDILDSPLIFDCGDQDGVLLPTDRGFLPIPWLESPSALLPVWMFHDDSRPYEGDPRHALNNVLKQYRAKGLTPVVATELEFYLVDDTGDELRAPASPRSGKRHAGTNTLGLRALDAFDAFFTDLYDACDAMDIPADTTISEAGPGQFEINLMHSDNAMKAADDAWLFKMLIRGMARKHGFAASFIAKLYSEHAGNGLHMHFSVINDSGENIFDDGTPHGTADLKHAVAGCLKALPDSTLFFAPHKNSYDRLVPERHAPTGIAWAYENRTAAVRIPSGNPKARRIEHRVAGGDTNPYLVMAAILGAALYGIENKLSPPDSIKGNAYAQPLEQIPDKWAKAIDAFENSTIIPHLFHEDLIQNYLLTKRQEMKKMAELSEKEQISLYLDTV